MRAKLINGSIVEFVQPSNILGDATQFAIDNGYKEVIYREGNGGNFEEGDFIVCEIPKIIDPIQPLSKLEFLARFTDAELVGIYTEAKTSVLLEIWLDKFKLSESIDLQNQLTISGLQYLESIGLLNTGRANEILT